MKSIQLLICIFTFSCTNSRQSAEKKQSLYDSILTAENFDTTVTNSDKCCLYYKGKPHLAFGQNINQFDTTLAFRYDPNGCFQDYYSLGILDYLSLDDFYSAELPTGKIVGVMFFTTDKQNRIFKLNLSFKIYAKLETASGSEIINYLRDKYFPCLPADFKSKQQYELIHKNFVEQFRLYQSPDSADVEHGFKPHWSLDYSIRATKKNGL